MFYKPQPSKHIGVTEKTEFVHQSYWGGKINNVIHISIRKNSPVSYKISFKFNKMSFRDCGYSLAPRQLFQ